MRRGRENSYLAQKNHEMMITLLPLFLLLVLLLRNDEARKRDEKELNTLENTKNCSSTLQVNLLFLLLFLSLCLSDAGNEVSRHKKERETLRYGGANDA